MRVGGPLAWAVLYFGLMAAWAQANGVVRDGIGAIAGGRGGTNIAHSDTGAVLHDNPAGIMNIRGWTLLELGADGYSTDLDYADPINSTNARVRPLALPHLSWIRKSCDDRWAYGFGVYSPAGFAATWDMNSPLPGGGQDRYKSFAALIKVLPCVAVRLTDRLSVGGTLGVAACHGELEGPVFLQSFPFTGTPTRFDLQGTAAAPTWSVGLQYELSDRTTLGISYIEETPFELHGSALVTIFGPPPFPQTTRFDATTDLVFPRSLGLGLKHDLCRHRRVSADVVWVDWSHAFDQVDIHLRNPDNGIVEQAVGSRVSDTLPLDWDDSISVRLGYEWFTTPCDVWRFGYTYNSRIIPSSTLTPYIPATLEHTFAIGYGQSRGRFRYDLAYQFMFGPERQVGTSFLAGGDFDDSELKAQAHFLMLSLQWR